MRVGNVERESVQVVDLVVVQEAGRRLVVRGQDGCTSAFHSDTLKRLTQYVCRARVLNATLAPHGHDELQPGRQIYRQVVLVRPVGDARHPHVVPVLLKRCLWDRSAFQPCCAEFCGRLVGQVCQPVGCWCASSPIGPRQIRIRSILPRTGGRRALTVLPT